MSAPLPFSALASVDDLVDRLGREVDDAERARAEAALEDASALVREEARRDWTEGAPPAVQAVVLTAALRVMRNPDGITSETIGPYSYKRRDQDADVYLSEAEKAIVRRYRQSSRGLWTLPTTREEAVGRTIWYEDSYGFELFPLEAREDFPG